MLSLPPPSPYPALPSHPLQILLQELLCIVRALEWSGQNCRVSSDSLYTMDSRISTPLRLLDSSVGKESACNAGDPCSIPVLVRSPGEGIGYPLQYSWASLVAQLVKNPSAMWETWVQSLGWEDLLEKGKATHSSILAWRTPWTIQSMGLQRVGHD